MTTDWCCESKLWGCYLVTLVLTGCIALPRCPDARSGGVRFWPEADCLLVAPRGAEADIRTRLVHAYPNLQGASRMNAFWPYPFGSINWANLSNRCGCFQSGRGTWRGKSSQGGRPADSSRASPRSTAVHLPFAVAIIEVRN